jgi:hypothetical protein
MKRKKLARILNDFYDDALPTDLENATSRKRI